MHLIPLLGALIEAVFSAGKYILVGVFIRCIQLGVCIPGVAKQQCPGLALIGAARQKQCQADNGKVSCPASKKAIKTKFPTVARL